VVGSARIAHQTTAARYATGIFRTRSMKIPSQTETESTR
jgi:hypothetical protein